MSASVRRSDVVVRVNGVALGILADLDGSSATISLSSKTGSTAAV